jgi:hypothetical protein
MLASIAVALALQAPDANNVLVTITVAGDGQYTRAHTIVISSLRPDGDSWTAMRTWEDGAQTLTSIECPAIAEAARTFEDLPPVVVDSPVMAASRGEPWPIGPILLHGFETTLAFQTTTADGSVATVELSGGNAYRRWGHTTVAALIGCWGPLAP